MIFSFLHVHEIGAKFCLQTPNLIQNSKLQILPQSYLSCFLLGIETNFSGFMVFAPMSPSGYDSENSISKRFQPKFIQTSVHYVVGGLIAPKSIYSSGVGKKMPFCGSPLGINQIQLFHTIFFVIHVRPPPGYFLKMENDSPPPRLESNGVVGGRVMGISWMGALLFSAQSVNFFWAPKSTPR